VTPSTTNGKASGQKKNPKVEYKAEYEYEAKGDYKIMVKVVDIFGNDTNKLLKVSIK